MCIHIARDGKSRLFVGRFAATRFLMLGLNRYPRRRAVGEKMGTRRHGGAEKEAPYPLIVMARASGPPS